MSSSNPKASHPSAIIPRELEALWMEAQSIERNLSDWETNKRKERKITLKDGYSEKLRLALLEIYEDILLSEYIGAFMNKSVDDRLWNAVFYSRIEELRSIIGKFQMDQSESLQTALDELDNHLQIAIAFYQTFIIALISRLDSDPNAIGIELFMNPRPKGADKDPKTFRNDIRFQCLHKAIIYMGDIARYRTMYLPSTGEYDLDPMLIYKQALRLNPCHGKPHSQLAILATNKKDYLSVIYWYSVSLLNTTPFPVAIKNILTFHARTTSKWIEPLDTTNIDLESLSRLFIRYHREVVYPEDQAIANMTETEGHILSWHATLTEAFSFTAMDNLPAIGDTNKAELIFKMCIILIVGATCLQEKFEKTVYNHLTKKSVEERAGEEEEQTFDPFASDDPTKLDPCFLYLKAAGLVCIWLTLRIDTFKVISTYAMVGKPLHPLLSILFTFSRSLCNLVNLFSSFADMDGSSECLPEDVELLGLSPFNDYYKKLSQRSTERAVKDLPNPQAEQLQVRISRIGNLAKVMSEDKEKTPFLVFEEKREARFVVLDDETKKLERDKMSKALAVEFLKNQIGSLESSLEKMKVAPVPIYILDADSYICHLQFVKATLMSKKAIIVLPLDVTHDLDKLKKGTDNINVRSREVIRYLEQRFKYRCQNLRAQQDVEVEDLPAIAPSLASYPSPVPPTASDPVFSKSIPASPSLPTKRANAAKAALPASPAPSASALTSSDDDTPVTSKTTSSSLRVHSSTALPPPSLHNSTISETASPSLRHSQAASPQVKPRQLIPKSMQGILKCCLYYKNHVASAQASDGDLTIALVTDDPELKSIALALGIVVKDVKELSRRRKRR
ncbi:Protein smg7 [Phlyctochytrium planicorne]|nr:Protein smg7 [Phlyctochytrium planicorne]